MPGQDEADLEALMQADATEKVEVQLRRLGGKHWIEVVESLPERRHLGVG